jgi:DNA polymerase-3 subunit beta
MTTETVTHTYTLEADNLRRALMTVSPAIATRGSLPVLGHVLLEHDENGARITATDLDLTITVQLEAAELCPNETPLRALLPPRDAKSFLAKKKGALMVSVGFDTIRLEAGGMTTELRTGPLEEWPNMGAGEAGEAFELEAAVLLEVLPAVSSDDSRPILAGLLIDGPERVIVATDSYRLHAVDSIDCGPSSLLIPRGAIVAACKAAKAAKAGGITCNTLGERDAVLSVGAVAIRTRLIEGEFPKWRTLIADEKDRGARIVFAESPAAILEPMTKNRDFVPVRVSAGANGFGVRLELNQQDVGTIAGEIRGSFPHNLTGSSSSDREIVAFNPAYFLEAIAGLEAFEFEGSTALRPWLASEYRATGSGSRRIRLLMPVRVS